MARLIKFRIWEVPTNKFHYNIDEVFKNPSVIPSKIFNGEDKLLISQQWTGLFDKSGREIYEGDIIEHVCDVGCYKFSNGEVIVGCIPGNFMTTKKVARVVESIFDRNFSVISTIGFLSQGMTVIGNIFENPKLLS